MKNILKVFLIIVLFIGTDFLANANPKLSSYAYKLSKLLGEQAKQSEKLLDDSEVISVLFKFNDNFDIQKAKDLGVKMPTVVSGIATAQIKINNYLKFINLDGIEYVEAGNSFSPLLDSAKSVAHIKEVTNGTDLPKAYNGEGVVVGIIDAGFDYTHPAFTNPTNNTLIISRVWEQGKEGDSPKGFTYGRELIGSEAILQAKTDVENFSHGTHVAGIAVGQDIENSPQSIGIAPKAELVIVALKPPAQQQWKNTSASDIVDGVNYIFKYAESIGKPAVVNLSWGGQIGPHDGTSLFSQAIDKLVGKGKLFVTSAGNDGTRKLHISKTLQENEPLITYIQNRYNKQSEKNGIWFDAWGEENKPFEFNFEIIDKATFAVKYQTEFHSTQKDTVIHFLFDDGKYKADITVHLNKCPYNNKPHAFVDVECNKKMLFRISAKAKEGKVNIWNWYLVDYYGIQASFTSAGQKNAITGDSQYTVSDFASSKKAIAVGAMVSKNHYINSQGGKVNSDGVDGGIAFFSSKGPSADGRVKPDIVAPGMVISSAVSSYDKIFEAGAVKANAVTARVEHNGKQYPYACLMGTSMSSPVVSGAVALMLSANPNLTPQKTLDLLKISATQDDKTKEIPNATWGWGKLNLKKAFTYVGIDKKYLKIDGIEIYPNPAKTKEVVLNMKLKESSYLRVSLNDVLGKEMFNIYEGFSAAGNFSKSFDVSALKAGTYFVKTFVNGRYKVKKLIIER